ncbi:hypothetical protein SAMN02910265_02163 [Ruminococcus flavefaciens]|uniref:Uncharacterized protein n=1 Tax=Ruminococcus flavefaciens TaxID=1265 RepID=A0A1H6K7G0_RUMFL|nr:hypothetical protein [Ruminococcus flavefaciens]SEH69248.1 hypothetical protein SAMN02910265_02163 [Ruminococcus flavefaciens]
MNENRKIGFEVLENADEKKIKEMGADTPILTQNAKDRMLKMSKEKFNRAKGITETDNTYTENDEYTVSGNAEEYKRSKIKRIVTAAASCAAAAVLIGTTAIMLHRKPDTTVIPEQTITTNANQNVTNTGTTVTNTGTGTVTTSSTETLPEMTTVTTYVAKNFNISSPVPDEEIARARQKVIDDFIHTAYAIDVQYKYIDMNADGTSELMVFFENAYYQTLIYRYNGSEYVCDINEYGRPASIMSTSMPKISDDESCIYLYDKESGGVHLYITMNEDYSLDIDDYYHGSDWEDFDAHRNEADYRPKDIWYNRGDKVSEEEYNSRLAKYSSYNFNDINDFVYVIDEADGVKEYRREMEEQEQQRAEQRKADPHFEDFATVDIDKSFFLNKGILESGTQYIVEHTDTYADGTVLVKTDNNDIYSDDPDSSHLGFCVDYGKNDDAPCHIKVRCRPNDKQEYFDLCDLDIDFKNKSYYCGDVIASNYISVEFIYFSECYDNE